VARDQEQMAARAEKRGDVSRGLRTKRGGQDLERVRFENKIPKFHVDFTHYNS